MPDTSPDLPADLIQLQRDYDTAHAAVEAYDADRTADYAQRYPFPRRKTTTTEKDEATGEEKTVEKLGDPVWNEDVAALRNAWTDEENDQLQRLRDERETARKALWAHPQHEAVRAAGRWDELKKTAAAGE